MTLIRFCINGQNCPAECSINLRLAGVSVVLPKPPKPPLLAGMRILADFASPKNLGHPRRFRVLYEALLIDWIEYGRDKFVD